MSDISVEQHACSALEFTALLDLLAARARTEPGRRRVHALAPSADHAQVCRWLDETTECTAMLDSGDVPGFAGIADVEPVIQALPSIREPLEPAALLDLAAMLDAAMAVRLFFESRRVAAPLMCEHAERITPCADLVTAVHRCIDSDRTVKDHASSLLNDLRRRINQLRGQVNDRLRRLLDAPEMLNVFENRNVSTRNGRPVLAVKSGARNAIHGTMLDKSNTGATMFIEPHAISELVNGIEEARFDEAREVTRILWDITKIAATHFDDLVITVDVLATIDITCAKARFSHEYRMTRPVIAESPLINLIDARHPLLLEYARRAIPEVSQTGRRVTQELFDRVVPMNVRLGDDFDCIVVTGPNTGGKTVALKTLGLIALMARAGMHIPAAHGSTIAVFDGVYADIGDEQSIEQSLSTFSAHMTMMVRILESSGPRTLILLDELGSGTDPAEGAALGSAILDFLRMREARVIATTHLGALKMYAYSTPRTENASMQFDAHTLQPTFRLLIGHPGSSNALAIARRLNMPAQVLDAAAKMLDSSVSDAADLINKVQESRIAAEDARTRAQALQADLARKTAEAKREHQRALDDAQHCLEYTMRDIQAIVVEYAEAAKNAPSPWADKARALRERLLSIASGTPLALLREAFVTNVKQGDRVFVMSLQSYGEVRDIRRRQKIMRVLVDGVECDIPFSHIAEKPFAKLDARAVQAQKPQKPAAPPPSDPTEPSEPPTPEARTEFIKALAAGDKVYVPVLKSKAVVVSHDKARNDCTVRVGALEFTVSLSKLRPLR